MSTRSRSIFLVLVALFVLTLFSASVVRSEPDNPSALQFPVVDETENGGDLCAAGTVTQSSSSSCPINCFRADPVCGADGVTYWCGCPDAHCAGTSVVKLGFCDVGNGGSGSLSGQAFLLVHIVWLVTLGFSVLFGLL